MRDLTEIQDKLQRYEERLCQIEERGTNQRLIQTYLTRIELLDWILKN